MKRMKSSLVILCFSFILFGSTTGSLSAQQTQMADKLVSEERLVPMEGGTGQLVNGIVTIHLNANTLQQMKDNNYIVSLTPIGECGQLKIQQKSDSQFVVAESSSVKTNGSFDYVVFIKKTIYKGLKHETVQK